MFLLKIPVLVTANMVGKSPWCPLKCMVLLPKHGWKCPLVFLKTLVFLHHEYVYRWSDLPRYGLVWKWSPNMVGDSLTSHEICLGCGKCVWKLSRIPPSGRSSSVTFTNFEMQTWSAVTYHHSLRLPMWRSCDKHVMWTRYGKISMHVNMAHRLWHKQPCTYLWFAC